MGGYFTQQGFIGFVDGKKRLFVNDSEYYECVEENDDENDI